MDSNAGLESISRQVLAVGIPLRPEENDGPPGLGELAPLEEATVHASEVSRALSGFGYVEYHRPDGDWDPGDGIRQALTSQRTAVLVVHIVAHGELSTGGERGLRVIGRDRRAFRDSVFSWIDLIEYDPDEPRPLTLFILDLCYSGAAAVLPWHQEMATEQRRAWVIAATGRESLAFDYRLSRAIVTVLNGYRNGVLRVDPSFEYIPLGEVAQEIRREVASLDAGVYPQSVEISRVPLGEKPDHLRFFSNPGYQPSRASALSGVDDGMVPLLDEAFDWRHFVVRGAGTEAPGFELGQGYFRGRDNEVGILARWFNGEGSGLRVVTGKPGVGKSALLGVLVCAAHPQLRNRTQPLWSSLHEKPARNDRLAVVHARRRSLEEIAESLARQMGATEADRPVGGWDAEGLARLAGAPPLTPYTLVIDALDEADRPQDVTQALLMPLAQTAHTERGAAVRLLVGTRTEPRFARLLEVAQATGSLIDLDQAKPDEVHRALLAYLGDLLADTDYASLYTHAAGKALAEAVAGRLTGVNDPAAAPDTERPLGWGEFLVAGLYLRHILGLPVESDPARARELGLAVPLDLPGLLDLDLARQGDQPWLRPVLAALAHAEGQGMPERVIAHISPRLTSSRQSGGEAVSPKDLREALDKARFYLRRDVDTNATTLYRLFHEGLAEHLRTDPYRSPMPGGGMSTPVGSPYALTVYEGLLQSVPSAEEGRHAWHVADPYLLRHAAQHAGRADGVDELLEDPEYLVYGEPEMVNAVLAGAKTSPGLLVAAVYRASYGVHRGLRPEQRRQILALDAARFRVTELSRELARWADWQPVWATGGQVSVALLATLTGHTGGLTDLAVTTVDGRPVAITTSDDQTARVWDLATGHTTVALTGHTGPVTGVAVTVVAGRPVAITISEDDTVRVWDLATGQTTLTGHTSQLTGVDTATIGGRPVAITTSRTGTARVWDLATGQTTVTFPGQTDSVLGRDVTIWRSGTTWVSDLATSHTGPVTGADSTTLNGRPVVITTSRDGTARVWDRAISYTTDALPGHTDNVTGVATTTLDGRPVAITTSDDDTARVWDLATGHTTLTLTGHTGMTGVATTTLDGRPVAITTGWDCTARVRDLATGYSIAGLRGHLDAVTDVATDTVDGRPVAITTSRDGTAMVWDLATGHPTATLAGHTRELTGVATDTVDGRPVAITTSRDGTARVWDLATGHLTATLAGHTRELTGVATITVDGRPVAITTSDDGTARVWDLATGYSIAVLTGHIGDVSGVATTTFGGRPVAITIGGDQTARVWDVATACCQATWPFPDALDCIAIATDGNVVLGMGHEVIVFDLIPFLRELP